MVIKASITTINALIPFHFPGCKLSTLQAHIKAMKIKTTVETDGLSLHDKIRYYLRFIELTDTINKAIAKKKKAIIPPYRKFLPAKWLPVYPAIG